MKFSLAFLFLISSNAFAHNLGDYVRNTDGSIKNVDQFEAAEYCQQIGSRLPTARELALYSIELGAQGIVETAYPNLSEDDPSVVAEIDKLDASGFLPVMVTNDAKDIVVDFYFDPTGFVRPTNDPENMYVWASTFYPYHDILVDGVYLLYNSDGDFWVDNRDAVDERFGVRCVL